jgi:hypothetical protein
MAKFPTARYKPEGAIVEIIDGMDGVERSDFLMPDRVLVNGTDVGFIAENGLKINACDAGAPATVTITLVPKRIEIKRAEV